MDPNLYGGGGGGGGGGSFGTPAAGAGGKSRRTPPPPGTFDPAYDPLLGLIDFAANGNGGGTGGGLIAGGPAPFAATDPFASPAAAVTYNNTYNTHAAPQQQQPGRGYTQMQPSQLGGAPVATFPFNGQNGQNGQNGGGVPFDDSLQFLFGVDATVGTNATSTATTFGGMPAVTQGYGAAGLPPPPQATRAPAGSSANAGLGALGIGIAGGMGGDVASPFGVDGRMNNLMQQHQYVMNGHMGGINANQIRQQQRQHQQRIQQQRKASASSRSRTQPRQQPKIPPQAFASSMFDPIDVFSAPPAPASKSNQLGALSASKAAVPTRGHTPPPVAEIENDEILCDFKMKVENLSTEEMTAAQVLDQINKRTDEVITLFLPCVDFLVQCQQELRAGLQAAQKKRYSTQTGRYQNTMTPRQFYNRYIAPLPSRFYQQNQPIMPTASIQEALKGIQALCDDAKRVERSGCDPMKTTFLGGMREGQSWGLRKWLSKNGGALKICNDLELIMGALRKLDKKEKTTMRMAEIIRPRAQLVFDRLKADVPKAYQEHSSAHPYLPFFHRLEGVLKGLATFDPEDDDVVCLDDDSDVEEVEPTPVKSESNAGISSAAGSKRPSITARSDDSSIMDSSPKRIKREDSSISNGSALAALDSAFGDALAKLADQDDNDTGKSKGGDNTSASVSGRSSVQMNKPEPTTIDLLDSSDEEDEEMNKPAPTHAAPPTGEKTVEASRAVPPPAPPAVANPAASSGSSRGWRCPQCTYLNKAGATTCKMCTDDDDNDFESDALLKALIDGTFADAAASNGPSNAQDSTPSISAPQQQAYSVHSLCSKLDSVISGFQSNMHYMLRPVEIDAATDHWNEEHNYVWCLKLLKMLIQRPDAVNLVNEPDDTEIFLAGWPAYSAIIKHPLSFGNIVSAITESDVGSHMWGDGKLASLPKYDIWQGKSLLEAIDIVMINEIAYFGDRDKSKKSNAQKLRNYFWKTIDEKSGHNKSLHPKRRKPSDGFIRNK